MLWSGDSHAVQGNGEINLTAIESAFNELNLTIEVLKGQSLIWPRIESDTHWITVGYDRDLNIAMDILEEETLKFLADTKGLSSTQAQRYMAAYGDCRVVEVVNQLKGVTVCCPGSPVLCLRPIQSSIHRRAS